MVVENVDDARPVGVAVCGDEVLVSLESGNCIRVYSREGQFVRDLLPPLPEPALSAPSSIVLYRGRLFVCDTCNKSIVIV